MTCGKTDVNPALLAKLGAFIETHMGLHYPPAHLDDLARGLGTAASDFGFDSVQACAEWLLSSPTLQPMQIKTLANHLTIGETHFFRDKKLFEILETQVFPEIINSRRGGQQNLRIWSAACSSGEEPYSLAILLARMLPDLQNWNISILATDISPSSLKKAGEGLYSEWSFRDTPSWVKERCFARAGKKFQLHKQFRRMVTFAPINLIEDGYPAIINGTNAMDIIFCRNVLMYFSRDHAEAVTDNLARCLVDGGWLVFSPFDYPGSECSAMVHRVSFPGALFYRKGPKPPIPTQKTTNGPTKSTVRQTLTPTPPVQTTRPAIPPPPQDKAQRDPRENEDTTSLARQVRQLADQGKLAEALTMSEEAVKSDKLNPSLYYLQASILQEIGKQEEAAAALQRALYIDQEFAVAHFALGHLLHRQKRYQEAGKHLEKARSLLSGLAPEDIPPEGEGISAGRLIALIHTMTGDRQRRAE